MMKTYRQGDVLLREVKAIPKDARLQESKEDRIVLAYGEVTGHAHAIHELENVDVFVGHDRLYLTVKAETALRHEEHATITLPPGKYERVIQREYSPEKIRNVAD